MQTHQGKRGKVMLEQDLSVPTILVMTTTALIAQGTGVRVSASMTGVAFRVQGNGYRLTMAKNTVYAPMQTGKGKIRVPVMVEIWFYPASFIVTGGAFLAVAGGMYVIIFMTGVACSIRSGKLVRGHPGKMTLATFQVCVATAQTEIRLCTMIKSNLRPLVFPMALCAVFTKAILVGIINDMAGSAPSVRLLVCTGDVTLSTFCIGVCSP
jgi:hypothetical protein